MPDTTETASLEYRNGYRDGRGGRAMILDQYDQCDKDYADGYFKGCAEAKAMTTTKREYKLAADPIRVRGMEPNREIVETVDGHRKVVVVVPDAYALDVLHVIRRAYQDGREDRASEDAPRRVYTHDADGAIIAVDARDNIPKG